MKIRNARIWGLSGILLTVCAACSSGDSDGLDVKTNWLGPLYKYERITGKDNFGIFLIKGEPGPTSLERIMLETAEITISARSDLNSIDPAAYGKLRAELTAAFRQELSKQFTVSASPGPGVYKFRAALTNLTAKRKVGGIGPPGLADLEFQFGNSAIEAELRDTRSNMRHSVIVLKAQAANTSWLGLADVFRKFAADAVTQAATARDEIKKRASRPKFATKAKQNK